MKSVSGGRALALALFVLSSCSGNKINDGSLAIDVDATLNPEVSTMPDRDGAERQVAAYRGENGTQTDLVLGELVAVTSDTAALKALVERWSGSIAATHDFAATGLSDVPTVHRIKLDTSKADVAALLERVKSKYPEAVGKFRTSSEEAQKLLAVAMAEAAETGIGLSPNWVSLPHGMAEATTNEAPTGGDGFVNNAFAWPYMTRGSAQDIGVGAAWQALLAAGKLENKVRILVYDNGFALNDDYPASRSIFGAGWNVRSIIKCGGGGDCPWHGMEVTTVLMGQPDNGYGAAGPAGPVGELVAVQAPSTVEDWIASVLGGWSGTLVGATAQRPRMINASSGFELDLGWEVLSALFGPPVGVVLSQFTAALRLNGTLMFASAGNAGKDVDNNGQSPEGSLFIPCELAGVICVGGMDHDSTARAGNSNYGSAANNDSVDIYGPYYAYVGADPDRPGDGNVARRKGGTSFASPFVAGVAALVWAADPTLSAEQVWGHLRNTAHVGGVHTSGGNQLRINAFGAVMAALGDSPPYLRIDRPTDGATTPWRWPLPLSATTWDADGDPPVLTWSSNRDGAIGTGTPFNTSALSVGAHVLTATAVSGGRAVTASVGVTVTNSGPSISVDAPTAGQTFCPNEAISFQATASDLNNPDGFPNGGISWTSSPSGVTGTGSSHSQTVPTAGTYTVTATATDELGLSATDMVSITVNSCTNQPPTVAITQPAKAASSPDLEVYTSANDVNGNYALITLRGNASDPEDGALTGATLVWTTNKGEVQPGAPATGTQQLTTGGSPAAVKLYSSCLSGFSGVVDHVVTLTVTDSGAPSGVPQTRSVSRVIRVRTLC